MPVLGSCVFDRETCRFSQRGSYAPMPEILRGYGNIGVDTMTTETLAKIILSNEERRFIMTFCAARPLNAAAHILEYEGADEEERLFFAEQLRHSAKYFESIRLKIAENIRQ
jgi:hypothetical protein